MRPLALAAIVIAPALLSGCCHTLRPVVINVVIQPPAATEARKPPSPPAASVEIVRTYTLDRQYYEAETKPGGLIYEKVLSMMELVDPGKRHIFSVNAKMLSLRTVRSRIKDYDRLVPEMLCDTAHTGQACGPVS